MDERPRFVQYFKAKKVTIEMARDRGYEISELEKRFLTMEFEQFWLYYLEKSGKGTFDYAFFDREHRTEIRETVRTKDPNTETVTETEKITVKVLVFKFAPKSLGKTFGIESAKEFLAEMKDTPGDIRTGILIIGQQLSNKAKAALEDKLPFKIQIFQLNLLQYNPTKHMFAPKYRIMTNREQREFLKANGIKIKELPLMSIEDPIARYFGLENGRIVEKTVSHFVGETMTDSIIEYSVVENTPL